MNPITSPADLDDALRLPLLLLFKHSRSCSISIDAWHHIASLEQLAPALPIFSLDVRDQRALARSVASALDVRHESPQAILIRDGVVVWHGSHFAVSAEAVLRELASSTASVD